jgi:hypothetical protein
MVVNIRVEQHLARLLRTAPGAVKHAGRERENIGVHAAKCRCIGIWC